MKQSTDHKDIDLYDFQLDVIRGKAGGRILWQPRIGCWYDDKKYAGEELPGVFKGMDLVEIYRELGCSNRIYDYNDCFWAREDETVVRRENRLSALETEYIADTPVGSVNCIIRGNTLNPGTFPKKWWVEDIEDLKVMAYILGHQTWEWREDVYQSLQKKWGRIGAPAIFMPRVNIQYLYIDLMGTETAVYLLSDYQEEVEAFFAVLQKNQEQMIEVINRSPIEMIDFGDNLHGGMLPPAYVENYILPAYRRRCELLHRGGKFVYAHWDGNTKTMLKYARQTGLDGIEAITPEPQGDVTLREVKEALGDMWLIDGIAAILFDSQYPEEALRAQVQECIDLFAPHLILGISDELSSIGNIERVRLVGEMVDEYNRKL